ncbi:beta-xylosidase [Paenibacillus sp. PK3_47]|uniref:family 43 glycosylhydrolase n=1 Tax=Paenibacillus sp. PK3_47 TaxID=2072642 RepID=UPI00201DBB48|nr:family 43 glycosylhydrolase [Paenibacillus sp. PK3_47]UQZ32633.1 beta-xylosidase [Paenibacillus sp. PK3_47]
MEVSLNTSVLRSGVPLPDTDGNPVHAHGGHMLFENGYYYWFGENRTGRRLVSCYRSADLAEWEWRSDVLTLDSPVKPTYHRTSLELEPDRIGAVIERPKVLYNAVTGKYVMWMHWENGRDYSAARCAVADCDTVDGDYVFRGSFNPAGNMSRDCTLFQDDDGTAYFVSAARENADLILYRLSPDYLSIEEQVRTLWPGQAREAPAIMKREGVYFLISSACTGWLPNQGAYAWADQLTGRWSPLKPLGDITTYDSQPAFILPVTGKERGQTSYLYVGDRWDPTDYHASSYVFLPLSFPSGREMKLEWCDAITVDASAGEIAALCGPTSGRFRLKSVGTELYVAAGEGTAAGVGIGKLAYGDTGQLWSVEHGPDGTASIKAGDKILGMNSSGSLKLDYPMNDETAYLWRFTEIEDSLIISCGEDLVLTAVKEAGERNGRLCLEPRRSHDPRLGRDRQLFQLIPVRP